MIIPEEINHYSATDCAELDALMHQLSPTSVCTETKLRKMIENSDSHLFVIRLEGHIVASSCLCVAHTTEFTLGFVEAVIVSEAHRGRHYGRILIQHLMAESKRLGVEALHLTSNPRRVAANALYQSLGFVKYDTNVYQLEL